MKALLLYKDKDFDMSAELSRFDEALIRDLELSAMFKAMAKEDRFIAEAVKKIVLTSLRDAESIRYRQDILKDCINNPEVIRSMYALAVETIKSEKEHYFGIFSRDHPSSILHRSVDVLMMFVNMLKRLKKTADAHSDKFKSEGFKVFFGMIKRELSDDYFGEVQDHLQRLKFNQGVLISAELGKSNTSDNYVLRKPHETKGGWVKRVLSKRPQEYTFYIAERDESGAKILSGLRDRGINLVANALAQSNDHILSFFNMLRTELGFYVGCLNLYDRLAAKGEPVCFPDPADIKERRHSFAGLYDVCLTLLIDGKVVGNDVNADNKDLVIITGANQGGKSTFLRSVGVAQLMMQCGMFVPAESFCANICGGLFTHFKREEDASMKSGKFDEELSRMSDIVDNIKPGSMILFNESFAATNEREGSEIARQITGALLEKRIKVFFVTHQYDFAHGYHMKRARNSLFLRAERQPDGTRTFKLTEGEPLETAYGEDLYTEIFGHTPQ